jgi:hypothetical protein
VTVGSSFHFCDDRVKVSNGVAELLEQGWLRSLDASGAAASSAGAALASFLRDKIEFSGSGLYGFHVDEGPLRDRETRVLFAGAVADLAHQTWVAIGGNPVHESLEFLVRLVPYLKAWWLESQEHLHALVRLSLDDEIKPLVLPVDAATRLLMRVVTIQDTVGFLSSCRRQSDPRADPLRELALRREQRDAWLSAGTIALPGDRPLEPLYELAKLEASLDLLDDAAATADLTGSLEQDSESAARARALAEVYRAAARNRAVKAP